MAESTVRLATSGMHCGSCAALIEMTLGDLPGVVSSKADHAEGTTMVTFDDAVVTVDAIVAAINGLGYEASVPA